MTMRLSAAMRNFINKYGSIGDALQNGRIEIYSGAQPSSADAAATGTLLCTISSGSGVWPTRSFCFQRCPDAHGSAQGAVQSVTSMQVQQ